MSQHDPCPDELGPVDYVVVEYAPGNQPFMGEMAAELMRLHDVGLIRVLDLLILVKDGSGHVEGHEPVDLVGTDAIRELESRTSEIFSASDVDLLAEAMRPDTVAGVVVWENTWALPFLTAAQRAGGQVVATGGIPVAALLASIEAELTAELLPTDS
jgi:Family of unknown function (DUF6325)